MLTAQHIKDNVEKMYNEDYVESKNTYIKNKEPELYKYIYFLLSKWDNVKKFQKEFSVLNKPKSDLSATSLKKKAVKVYTVMDMFHVVFLVLQNKDSVIIDLLCAIENSMDNQLKQNPLVKALMVEYNIDELNNKQEASLSVDSVNLSLEKEI